MKQTAQTLISARIAECHVKIHTSVVNKLNLLPILKQDLPENMINIYIKIINHRVEVASNKAKLFGMSNNLKSRQHFVSNLSSRKLLTDTENKILALGLRHSIIPG